jgi:phosphoribosylformylglycinamidine synthase
MNPLIKIITFPGTNCEYDAYKQLRFLGAEAELVWHQQSTLGHCSGIILPGGFAHGDYLRPGAIARFSPIMEEVIKFAEAGGPVVGICNGFQVLTECGLLPGALSKNEEMRFICKTVPCVVKSTASVLTSAATGGQELHLPINHGEGNYVCDDATLQYLTTNNMIVLSYTTNVNGSIENIAGITNKTGNVVGLMPHPERAVDPLTGQTDGQVLLKSFIEAAK